MDVTRRGFIAGVGASVGAVGVGVVTPATAAAEPPARKGRLKQSVCRWCFGSMSLDDLCREAAAMGYGSVELLDPPDFETPRRHGMTCAVASFVKSNTIRRGLNRTEHHDSILKDLEERLPLVKAAEIPNQIVFSGNRDGMDDREGLRNCVAGLKRIMPLAEQLGVTIVMELLNSKVDHKDYMCDKTPWGVEVCKQVASPRFKLLYDIYHMQIMEGDVIRTITDHFEHIGHFHTAGVPGRHEIDGTQELNYKAICEAIVAKGYTGFLGQEFMPRREPAMQSLREAFEVCDV
ncbi:MAG: TIM barrel protein [Phycisphaerae bacterium]|jgi:hydroxypyruvate isomerase